MCDSCLFDRYHTLAFVSETPYYRFRVSGVTRAHALLPPITELHSDRKWERFSWSSVMPAPLSGVQALIRLLLVTTSSAGAKVGSLPGLDIEPCFNHFSGYLATGTDRATNLFVRASTSSHKLMPGLSPVDVSLAVLVCGGYGRCNRETCRFMAQWWAGLFIIGWYVH